MKLHVELSATFNVDDNNIETCNDDLSKAQMFSVYIGNPLAFHVQDFKINPDNTVSSEELIKVYQAAREFALGLAKHLDCALEIKFESPNPFEVLVNKVYRHDLGDKTVFEMAKEFEERYIIKPRSE